LEYAYVTKQIDSETYGKYYREDIEKAKEMHKQEIMDAYKVGNNDYANFSYVATSGEDYYHLTFVSKGSSETLKDYHIVEANEMIELPKQKTLYTEEQVIGFAEWILNEDSKKVLTRSKESLLKEYIESLKQPKKD
jgi:hypothetical protein